MCSYASVVSSNFFETTSTICLELVFLKPSAVVASWRQFIPEVPTLQVRRMATPDIIDKNRISEWQSNTLPPRTIAPYCVVETRKYFDVHLVKTGARNGVRQFVLEFMFKLTIYFRRTSLVVFKKKYDALNETLENTHTRTHTRTHTHTHTHTHTDPHV